MKFEEEFYEIFHKMLNIDIKTSRVCSFLKSSFKSKFWIECVKYLQANAKGLYHVVLYKIFYKWEKNKCSKSCS